MAKLTKKDFLKDTIKHIDLKKYNVVPLVEAFGNMAYASREVARASKIYNMMLSDKKCSVILCIAGSLVSAGMKKVVVDMIQNNMVDAIVSNGANIVDQDFFEALGYKHYIGTPYNQDDNLLRDLHIDRIYDTYIDEDELKVCDETIHKIWNPAPILPANLFGKWVNGLKAKAKGKILSFITLTNTACRCLCLLSRTALPVSAL